MAQTFFIIILVILILDFLFERYLEYLNGTHISYELPDELMGIYDADKYKKSQEYFKANKKFSELTSTVSFIAIALMLFLDGFAIIDNFVRGFTDNPILSALLFFGIIGFLADLLFTPFTVYDTFVIEEKFGFNRTNVKTFILDKIKGWVLGAIIGGLLIAIIVWIYESTGNMFWLYTWIIISVFMVFFSMFYSSIIVPIFNKQTPLEEGELRSAIQEFAAKTGFKLDNIYVIDGSKRSSKSNAYFTGLGSKKRIVLFDTLIKQHTTQELVAVLAHEIGHYKKKHTLSGIALSIIQTGLMLFILSFFIRKDSVISQELCAALGAEKPSFYIGVIGFGILYTPLSFILGLLMNIISRKNEFTADKYAGENFSPIFLIDALKKLSVNNLSNLRPHPLYVFFHYSHPPLLQRIKALKSIK